VLTAGNVDGRGPEGNPGLDAAVLFPGRSLGHGAESARPRDHLSDMNESSFQDRPDPPAPPLLHAVWLGLRGEWAAAHGIVQADDGSDAAWVHAWLHRVEGDAPNAAYWYRRAGKAVAEGSTDVEGEAIARALSAR